MDDPLRPKTVPLSDDTILWFEFLLDPSLLTAHLSKEHQDPSPIELISQFLYVSPEVQCQNPMDVITPDLDSALNASEGLKLGRKQLALKILGLKVASHLKWNLDVIEKNLPLQKQVQLLSDLCTVTSGKFVSLPLSLVHECNIGPEGSKRAFNFALTLYHRWILRAQLLKELPARAVKPGFGHMLTTQEQANSFRDEMFVASLEPFTQTSIDFLAQIARNTDEPFQMLVYDSFVSLHSNSDRIAQNFDVAITISRAELKAQIFYDLCTFYLHSKSYALAREHAIGARKNLDEMRIEYQMAQKTVFNFCTFNESELIGYMLACGVGGDTKIGLLHRMNESVLHKYKNIVEILRQDNISNEIPLVNRRIVELDIEGSQRLLNLPKDLLVQVAALNVIKSIMASSSHMFSCNDYLQKYLAQNGLQILFEMVGRISNEINLSERGRLKQYFLDNVLSTDVIKSAADFECLQKMALFTVEELQDIRRQHNVNTIPLPPIACQFDWHMANDSLKIGRLEIGSIRRQLIACTSAAVIRKLLVKLAATSPTKPLWQINPSWIVPNPMPQIITSMQRGFLQDFSYIICGKAREMTTKSDFQSAIQLLAHLKTELQRPDLANVAAIQKLTKLIDWEILYIQICHSLEDWPKSRYDTQIMITKCKQCLMTMQNGDTIVPRLEILEYCATMLLNLNEWTSLLSLDKRFSTMELCAAFAAAVTESENFKAKKVCRDAWDYVLPMFSTSMKRGAAAARDSPSLIVSTNLLPFLKKLRNVTILTIVMSLLSRLHNILKDDSNMELVTDYLSLWPTSISNASGYSIRIVSETLSNLLKQAMHYYPQHIPWIRLKGELEFVNENNEAAMACYVNVLITGTEYCAIHLQRPLLDEHIVKRMIKCSSNLGCNMQAAILCQFLDDIDYVLAFKCISERTTFKSIGDKSGNFCDAMDSYYNCIWDPTLIEFIIHQHSKKGEHTRKQQAIAIMGLLELNANNNEEIKREAASIRRTRFLRALAKQYML